MALREMVAAHDLDRHYLAITWGMPPETEGRIEAALGRSTRDRKKQAVVPNGRYAATNWTVIRRLPPFASIVECRLETGRTHQIRRHAADAGHPVIGDRRHGGAAGKLWPRLALHAWRLAFPHPRTGEVVDLQVALPADVSPLFVRAGLSLA